MRDALTVLQKEMLELLADRHSFRGALGQTAVLLLFIGVYLPSTDALFWNDPPALVAAFVIFPSLLAATVAAEAFAGEAERKTLETLLATPLSDAAVFIGKAAWAVLYAFGIALAALALAVSITALAHGQPEQSIPWQAIPAASGAALGGAVLATASATWISSVVPVTRSAEQIARVVTLVLSAGIAGLGRVALVDLGWSAVGACELVLLVLGGTAVLGSARLFRRDRMFQKA